MSKFRQDLVDEVCRRLGENSWQCVELRRAGDQVEELAPRYLGYKDLQDYLGSALGVAPFVAVRPWVPDLTIPQTPDAEGTVADPTNPESAIPDLGLPSIGSPPAQNGERMVTVDPDTGAVVPVGQLYTTPGPLQRLFYAPSKFIQDLLPHEDKYRNARLAIATLVPMGMVLLLAWWLLKRFKR